MSPFFTCFLSLIALLATVTGSQAAIYSPAQQLPPVVIEMFKKTPSDLLEKFKEGGAEMIARVRDLGASDASTVPLLIGLLNPNPPPPLVRANERQSTAIATGLAQLAKLAAKGDQALATDIQIGVGKSGNDIAIAAYAAAGGDTAIASTGGGGAGGAGTGGGGQTLLTTSGTGGSGSETLFGVVNPVANNFTLGTTGSAGSGSALTVFSPRTQ